MQKISLDLDALAVESFDTTVAESGTRGTVAGHIEPIVSGVLCDMAVSWLLACDGRQQQQQRIG